MGIPNPFRLLNESLRIRIFALLTLLIVLISTTFIIIHFNRESTAMTERSVIEGNLLARLLAYNSRIGVFAEHAEMLREATDGILQNDNVISATVFSADGKILIDRARVSEEDTSVRPEGFPALFSTLAPLLEGRQKSHHREKAGYFEFFAPVAAGPGYASPESLYFGDAAGLQKDRIIGVVRVITDKKELNARLHSLLITTILLACLFLLIASISGYIIAQGLTRSLRDLMDGVTTLEQGDLSGRISVESHDELGKVSHAFNTMAEALERREREKQTLEEQLRIAREKLAKEEWERTFDTVPDQIAILDMDSRITRVNRSMATLLGIGKDEAVGTALFEYFDGTSHPPYEAQMAEVLAAGITYSTEIFKEKLDRFFFVTISPLIISGERTGAVYVARDITQNKQATETLRISEERFRIIAENINEVIWMADIDLKRMLYVSPLYERIFKRPLQALYDNPRSFIEAIHPEDQSRVLAGILNDRREPFDHEYRIILPDGSVRWIWDRGYPVRNEYGLVTFVTGVAEDITEKKKSEEERKAIQAKLVQTNKMTSLGLLVSGLAHEVNNPNSSIKLAAHILSKSWDDIRPILEQHYREEGDFAVSGQLFSQMKESMPQHISSITANSRRIEGIIKNLRDFAQKGVANLTYVVDVNTVISLSASILNTQLKQHTRRFKLSLDENLPPVRGNPQQLEQVIINLILNSIQSLPDRNGRVEVSTSFDAGSQCVMIAVADEGEGMPREVRERIFEPFFSTKLDRGGSGLGLAISNFIIKEHKGSMEFESEPGKGTTATIRLPALHGR